MELAMTRWLALDVGEARIGVASSDPGGFLASPYSTLRVSRDKSQTWAAIQRLVNETEAEGLIIGLPVSLDGKIHTQGEHIQAFAEQLRPHITIPIAFWDERYSTVEVERLLAGQHQDEGEGRRRRSKRRSRSARRHSIDALAAAVILQEYLDDLRSKTEDK
jgi:putative holliday junction resolvase